MAGQNEGGGSSTTVQKADPWSGQQPYLTYGFKEAQDQYKSSTPSYYPGSTVVPFSPETNAALDWQTNRAINGSPIQSAANNQLVSTLNGDYLYGGSGFNAAVDAATRKAMPGINSTFEAAGRTNSGLADVAKTQAISDAFASQYGQERDNQLKSMFFAPTIANQDYQDISKLAEVGAQREGMSQEQLGADIDRYNYNQNLPANKLADYMNLIQGNYGGSSTSTSSQNMQRNSIAGGLGGALSGASLASTLNFNPWLGAGLGMLGGIF